MLFPTVQFAAFFAITFCIAWALAPRNTLWRVFLLAASYLFYAAFDPRLLALLVALPLLNHLVAVAIHAQPSRALALTRLAVVLDLATLGLFKYQGFFASNLNDGFAFLGLPARLSPAQWTLPLGVSFITFQALSYVVDVRRGVMKPARTLDALLYVVFFPHLVAGPIVRASEFVPQVQSPPDPRAIESERAIVLITSGLFKKVVLASFLSGAIVDPVFARPSSFSRLELLAAVYGYAVQIYSDFSGYTDIAIGCALLLGVRFPQNFDAPYRAVSLQDFWRRWHMTLSRWLRDYLYISLGGSRGGALRTYANLFLTMLLGGLWHGAAWTFIAWGALHGAVLAIERALGWSDRAERASAGARALGTLVTFHVVCLGWVLFRAGTPQLAREVLVRIARASGPSPSLTPAVCAAIAAGLASHFVRDDLYAATVRAFGRLSPVAQGSVFAVSLAVISALGPPGVAPFIYFQF